MTGTTATTTIDNDNSTCAVIAGTINNNNNDNNNCCPAMNVRNWIGHVREYMCSYSYLLLLYPFIFLIIGLIGSLSSIEDDWLFHNQGAPFLANKLKKRHSRKHEFK